MSDGSELELPRKKKKKKPQPATAPPSRPKREDQGRVLSYVVGAFLLLLGIGMLAGFYYTQRAPSKLFNLLAGGGIAAFLSGIGLVLHPLDEERLDAFQNEPNPVVVFKIMPIFWKFWLLVIIAAMIGGFIYVAQTTVRVGA